MSSRLPAMDRYESDAAFRVLVDMMENHIACLNYTPSEMREAALLASIHYEIHHVHALRVAILPTEVRSAMDVMAKHREQIGAQTNKERK